MKPEELRKIESIVNEQIKAELDVFAKETKLADAKRVNGLRAVFGEVRARKIFILEDHLIAFCLNFLAIFVLFLIFLS